MGGGPGIAKSEGSWRLRPKSAGMWWRLCHTEEDGYPQLMPSVRDIEAHLAERTRPESAASWDPVGLQVGDPTASVARIAVCHEVSEAVVSAIETDPVELILTYHPLLFTPVNRVVSGRSPAARAMRLIRAGVSVLVTHTDFDAAPGGTADSLANAFHLTNPVPFGADEETGLPAIGRVGDFGHTLGALDARATDIFGISGLRVSGDPERELARVAVVPGSGSEFIDAAAEVADALVTGDISHHRAVHALDLGLAIVDPGHVATERPGMNALVSLAATVSDVAVVDLTDFDPETWR